MSEAEEIERLIDVACVLYGRCERILIWEKPYMEARENLLSRINSIITERDALKNAARSHRE